MTSDTLSTSDKTLPGQFDLRISEQAAIALADQIECALLACDCDCRLLYVNRAGRRALEMGNAIRLADERVRCSGTTQEEWSAAVRDAAIDQHRRLFWVGTPGDRTMIIAMPILIEGSANPTAIVMLGRRSVCSRLGLELLASRHALSFAERRAFGALIANASPREIAAMHGVTVAVVHAQLQSVRDKMGVRSIDALLLRAAQVPPVTSWQ